MNNKQIFNMITDEIKEELHSNDLFLWDIELIKEGASTVLRIYIDKQNKEEKVGISDCEIISRKISSFLDENDLIKEAFMLEVSSPGINRQLKKEEEYKRYLGHIVDVKLYSKIENSKEHNGVLVNYEAENESITLRIKNSEKIFKIKDIASTRLAITF